MEMPAHLCLAVLMISTAVITNDNPMVGGAPTPSPTNEAFAKLPRQNR